MKSSLRLMITDHLYLLHPLKNNIKSEIPLEKNLRCPWCLLGDKYVEILLSHGTYVGLGIR